MKKLIVIGLSLLLVGGAGVGGWFYLSDRSASAAEVDELLPASDPVYVEFDPLQLPVLGEGRIDELVNIALALEVTDQPSADKVIAFAPRLNDAYILALYGTLNAEDALENGAVDVTMIKRRLVEVSTRVLGAGVVKDALVQMVVQRRL